MISTTSRWSYWFRLSSAATLQPRWLVRRFPYFFGTGGSGYFFSPSMQPFDSARLHFRPLTAADTAGMFALDSDPAVHRYLGGIGGQLVSEPAQSAALIAYIQQQYAEHGVGRWAVILRETGEFMGWAGLKLVAGPINGETNYYDLGYRFMPRFWSQGYGFEAARAWLDYGFETLRRPRICAYVDWHNVASRRILSKIGMRQGPRFLLEGVPCIWYEAGEPAHRLPE